MVAVPPGPRTLTAKFAGLFQSKGLEGILDSSATRQEVMELLDGVSVCAVDHISRTEPPGQLEFPVIDVDADDPLCAGNHSALDAVQTDATTANHGHGGPRMRRRALRITAPIPVGTAQPTTAAQSRGTSF